MCPEPHQSSSFCCVGKSQIPQPCWNLLLFSTTNSQTFLPKHRKYPQFIKLAEPCVNPTKPNVRFSTFSPKNLCSLLGHMKTFFREDYSVPVVNLPHSQLSKGIFPLHQTPLMPGDSLQHSQFNVTKLVTSDSHTSDTSQDIFLVAIQYFQRKASSASARLGFKC